MPFDMRLPNVDTVNALQQAREGVGLTEYAGINSLKAELG